MTGDNFGFARRMRLAAVALLVVPMLSLVACGNDGELLVTPPGEASPARATPVPTPTSIPGDE